MSEQIELRVARSLSEVESLREPWVSWPGHRDSDIDFYLMIVQSYSEVVRPHVIALFRDGRPDAILIGRLEQKRLGFRVGYLNSFSVQTRCLTFVYGAIHGDASADNTELLLKAVMESLKQGEADVAALEFVPLDTPLYKLALGLPGILSRDTRPLAQGHDSLSIPGSIDDVYRRMSGERRNWLRRRIKKLETHTVGKLRIQCYRNPSELDTLFRDAEEIGKKTYQRGLGVGFCDDSRVRSRLGLGAERGWLRAYVLYLGERPCAFWIGMLYVGTFVSEYLGYDPEFRQFSPGMVLVIKVIEGFCKEVEGDIVRELDFGLGHAEYKGLLCSKSWQEAVVHVFSPTPKGLMLKSMRTVTALVNGTARRLLISTKVFQRIKRVWRDRLSERAQTTSQAVRQGD